jgi:hypothetical protein
LGARWEEAKWVKAPEMICGYETWILPLNMGFRIFYHSGVEATVHGSLPKKW